MTASEEKATKRRRENTKEESLTGEVEMREVLPKRRDIEEEQAKERKTRRRRGRGEDGWRTKVRVCRTT